MKRKICTVFVCIVFVLFLVTPPASNAASPTPTTTPTPTVTNSSTEAIEIPNGIPNQQINNSIDPEIIPITPTPNETSRYTIPGVDPKMDDFKIPSMDSISQWLMKTIPYMTAKPIKDKLKFHDDNLFVSGKVKRCVWIGGILLPFPFTQQGDVYETNLVKYLADLLSSNRLLASHLVRYSVTPIEESYDLNGPAYKIDSTELPCELPGKGTQQNPPKIIGLKKGFSIAGFIKEMLNSLNPAIVKVVSKQQTAEAERVHCTMDGCVTDNEDIDLAYVKTNPNNPPDEIARLQKSGGVVDSGFRAVFMDTKKKQVPHGQEPNFTDTNTLKTKQMENSANLIKCSLVPPAQRGHIALANEDCKGFVKNLPTTTSCDTELSDLTVSDSSCKLCNLDTLIPSGDSLMDQSLPNGLPQRAVQILEAAGSFYHVPASMLLGVMYNEGAFMHPDAWMWTDETVKEWSCPGNVMPKCEEFAHPQTNAKGPFGFLPSDWGMFSSAAHEFDPNRPLDKLSPCNFFDAAFAAAKEIYQDASHLYVDQTRYGMPPDSCNGIGIYKGRDRPTSCSVWTRERAALTEWQYGERTCNRTITSAVNFFNSYRCQ